MIIKYRNRWNISSYCSGCKEYELRKWIVHDRIFFWWEASVGGTWALCDAVNILLAEPQLKSEHQTKQWNYMEFEWICFVDIQQRPPLLPPWDDRIKHVAEPRRSSAEFLDGSLVLWVWLRSTLTPGLPTPGLPRLDLEVEPLPTISKDACLEKRKTQLRSADGAIVAL